MKPDYYVRGDGALCMSYDLFKDLPFESVCKTLGIPGYDKTDDTTRRGEKTDG
jgi:hypothetical protein